MKHKLYCKQIGVLLRFMLLEPKLAFMQTKQNCFRLDFPITRRVVSLHIRENAGTIPR